MRLSPEQMEQEMKDKLLAMTPEQRNLKIKKLATRLAAHKARLSHQQQDLQELAAPASPQESTTTQPEIQM